MSNSREQTSSTASRFFLPTMHQIYITAGLIILIWSLSSNHALAQSRSLSSKMTHTTVESNTQPLAILERYDTIAIPIPMPKPDPDMSVRAIHRIGTAFKARSSISIKSTDAGIIPRHYPTSGCTTHCGSIDFITQGTGLNAIAAGVIGGTIARKIGRPDSHPHTTNYYDADVIMRDSTQTTIALPDSPDFRRGDRVKRIDNMFAPDY
ncbi:hypothetical protein SAMN05216419_101243 [Nitrosomonas cryotolerans]|uniref:Uncharacterized protein n=1 Tax=Nitrosomonas cryotolerans ATCC 49181 TaxID=1131553 RepID=A0A1N6JH65_9PROT|nr:hypothetical protein [Nitrosomonas cryotolerans]SFP67423.1 hypothetical protein SAMN05216419_101243 [Nitrosomonas cryotolerans]SIO43386.1 hypothetical protein SAMN02743940_2596 [Nitrosomonas cryotolerans ATCC 49181]